jgi:hypothetical protein
MKLEINIAVAILYAALLCAPNGVMDAHASEEWLHEKRVLFGALKRRVSQKRR